MFQVNSNRRKGIASLLAFILSLMLFFSITTPKDRSQSLAVLYSVIIVEVFGSQNHVEEYINDSGQLVQRKNSSILKDGELEETALITSAKIMLCMIMFFIFQTIFKCGFNLLQLQQEIEDTEDELETIIEADELRKKTLENPSQTRLSIAGIPFPDKTDISNLIICGSSGSGKTANLREILAGIRRARRKAIIFDPTGELVSLFYRHGTDILLNPLDQRSVGWDIWCDCRHYQDYLQTANTLIADHPGQEKWVTGARLVLAKLAEAEGNRENPRTLHLMENIEQLNDEQIISALSNTEAATIIAENGENACFGIRGILMETLAPLKELDNASTRFSVRRWAFNENSDNWLFISTTPSEQDSLKSLSATWLNLAAKTLTGLHTDHLRRIFMVIDDLSSTHRIPALIDYAVQSRRTCASAIITLRSTPVLASIYGEEDSNALLRAFDNIVAMSSNDPTTQYWLSSRLGFKKTTQTTEVSYGNSDEKIQSQRLLTLPLVTPEEIARLPQLQGFVRFGNDLPTGRFHSVARELNAIAPAFSSKETSKTITEPVQQIAEENTANEKVEEKEAETAKEDTKQNTDNLILAS